jgi:RpiB/LacA/LacB family sugar-phosphate isomerase
MKIAFGCDHTGFYLRRRMLDYFHRKKYPVIDCGTFSEDSCDYPDFAEKVAMAVVQKKAGRGILICGTGVGMSIAANKIPGVRAAVCWNDDVAHLAAEHNRANILCLAARLSRPGDIIRWIDIWLKAKPAGGRHWRRVKKISKIEKKYCRR